MERCRVGRLSHSDEQVDIAVRLQPAVDRRAKQMDGGKAGSEMAFDDASGVINLRCDGDGWGLDHARIIAKRLRLVPLDGLRQRSESILSSPTAATSQSVSITVFIEAS